jgi:flagellar basal body-associated protein FliL
MEQFVRILIVVVALVGLALPFAVVGAQNTRTITITEEQVNNAYWVTNPARRSVTNISVDLQPGQAVVSATIVYRRVTYATVSTWTPSVSNGRLTVTLTSATANGQPASQDLINQINASIGTSWRRYWQDQAGTGRLQSVTVTDTDMTLTFAGR